MRKVKLSVVLSTRNEEKNIGRCLAAVCEMAREIIVADEYSADKTAAIARKFGAKVFLAKHDDNFHITKRKAIGKASGEWILQLDADEVVSSDLGREIREVVRSNPQENGFWIPRKNYFLGRFLTKGGAYPDYTLRLYRRGKGNLPGKSVHEQAEVVGKVGYLRGDLYHYSNLTFSEYLEKRFNRYTDVMAQNLTGGFLENLIFRPLFDSRQGFLSIYFRHLGFLDGFAGFIWAVFSALHFPIAYFKAQERKRGLSRGG